MTMDGPKLDSLIIENISDLDAIASRIEQLEAKVWAAQAHVLWDWAEGSKWLGEFDPEDDLCVWPPAWDQGDGPAAWFELGYGADEDDSGRHFFLTALSGAGGGRVCLWFVPPSGRAAGWRRLVPEYAERVKEIGFSMTERGKFYIDCTPLHSEMIEAVEADDFSKPMQHVRRALVQAEAASSEFLEMVNRLQAL